MGPETIQIIVQAGAVGILFTFGCGFFVLARLAINKGFEFVTNHMKHNTEAVQESVTVMREVVTEIKHMSEKLDKE